MKLVLLVFVGGGIGSVLRYLISLALHSNANGFPVSTFIANLLGCLLIGVFYALSSKCGWSQDVRLMLTTGLCGGFTTFSTFSVESLNLIKNGLYITSITYILISVVLGLCMVFFGIWLASR